MITFWWKDAISDLIPDHTKTQDFHIWPSKIGFLSWDLGCSPSQFLLQNPSSALRQSVHIQSTMWMFFFTLMSEILNTKPDKPISTQWPQCCSSELYPHPFHDFLWPSVPHCQCCQLLEEMAATSNLWCVLWFGRLLWPAHGLAFQYLNLQCLYFQNWNINQLIYHRQCRKEISSCYLDYWRWAQELPQPRNRGSLHFLECCILDIMFNTSKIE